MVCYYSKRYLAGGLIFAIFMFGGCCFFVTLPELLSRIVGTIGIGLASLVIVGVPIMMARSVPQVIIDDRGIHDRRLGKIEVIRWKDVRWMAIGLQKSGMLLCIEVFDPDSYLACLPRWQRLFFTANRTVMRIPELTVDFAGLKPGIKQVVDYLKERAEEYGFEFRESCVVRDRRI